MPQCQENVFSREQFSGRAFWTLITLLQSYKFNNLKKYIFDFQYKTFILPTHFTIFFDIVCHIGWKNWDVKPRSSLSKIISPHLRPLSLRPEFQLPAIFSSTFPCSMVFGRLLWQVTCLNRAIFLLLMIARRNFCGTSSDETWFLKYSVFFPGDTKHWF